MTKLVKNIIIFRSFLAMSLKSIVPVSAPNLRMISKAILIIKKIRYQLTVDKKSAHANLKEWGPLPKCRMS